MKYIIVIGDGMADEPLAELGGKTPLEYARTPNMDRMAREGACGMLRTIPDSYEAGSDIANMAILGYAPEKYYTGRGPLEAMSMGIDLAPDDVAYRCNLVTVENNTMVDFSSGHISSAEGEAALRYAPAKNQGCDGPGRGQLPQSSGNTWRGRGHIHSPARYCGTGHHPTPSERQGCGAALGVHGEEPQRIP